ncbi:hypothetical protein QR674_07920 [Acinetobacter chinensis]|uniref:Uncharacterized protein n=1 Tax=Acinetobacter chinensis TaxID=2004650 RepID=A0ABU3WER3_9GAMM|nr:hypothetical protein [Acinetobacter chinensis]MDV2468909.1 hypothetical protein [Acinetobacter chinensis]
MDTFMLCPLQSGYGFTPGQNLIEQSLRGGMPRQRLAFVGSVHQVTASVMCATRAERDYFWAFWRKKQRSPESWLWALQTDAYDLEEHECRFMAGSLPSEQQRNGRIVQYSFQVWVKPLHRSAELDNDIVDAWSVGLNPDVAALLERLANESMPNALR